MKKRILLTGAGGRLGSYLRKPLSKICTELVSTDIKKNIGKLNKNEKYISADLANFDQICEITKDVSFVCHFGALVDELPFNEMLGPNFIGSYNVWESARLNNCKRVIYASSIHAVGMYKRTKTLRPKTPHRADGFYGLSKCFTENLARMYFDKCGIESVCLRIATCSPVTTARSLTSWLSYDDLIQLVMRSIDTTHTGYSVVYGVSDNDRSNLSNIDSGHLGFKPKDNAEVYANKIFADDLTEELVDEGNKLHGGPFASTDLGVSAMDKMKIVYAHKGEYQDER